MIKFENSANNGSTLLDTAYYSMEEVNEVSRVTGWEADYRQLGKGPITSRWRSLHLGRSSLISHHVTKRMHARVAPPRGTVALGIAPSILIDGAEFGNDRLLVTDVEMDFVTPDKTWAETLVVPRPMFEASGRALFPRMRTNGELARVIKVRSSGWSALRGDLENLLRDGSMSPEDLSNLLCRYLDLMAGDSERRDRKVCLGNRSTGRVARFARDYIEDHYTDTIRMEDLCRCTGVSLRTLQRSFTEYFQVSPSAYIKARRLDAARKALLAGDSSRDPVTRIALDNGFNHLGRFSVEYRKQFGESPRETLIALTRPKILRVAMY